MKPRVLFDHQLRSRYASKKRSSQKRAEGFSLHPSFEHLTVYYLSEIFRNAFSALTHQAISDISYDLYALQHAFGLAKNWLHIPAVALNFHAAKAFSEQENEQHYFDWKNALHSGKPDFTKQELRSTSLTSINYCIRRMNVGKENFKREAFDLYREALDLGLLMENGQLSVFTYKNIIRLGMGLGEKAWTLDFSKTPKSTYRPHSANCISNTIRHGCFLAKKNTVK